MGELTSCICKTKLTANSLNFSKTEQSNKRWAAEVPAGREAAEQVAKEAGCTLDQGEIIPGTDKFYQMFLQMSQL